MNARPVKKAAMRQAAESGEGGHAMDITPGSGARNPEDFAETALARAMCNLGTVEEAGLFLRDLCTPGEISALSERWHVARLLDQGELSYRDIHDQTGVSTTTVARVARFLFHEPNRGYQLALGRLKELDHGQKKAADSDSEIG